MMKRGQLKAFVLAVFLICLCFISACSGCRPADTATVTTTNLGFVHTTDTVRNPSQNTLIEVFSDGKVAAQGTNNLTYQQAFTANSVNTVTDILQKKAGDIIRVTADYQYIKLSLFGLPDAILYSPTGEFVYQIPSVHATDSQLNYHAAYPNGTFSGNSHALSASIATAAEIASARNLALNPYDTPYVTELNISNAAEGANPKNSAAVANGEVLAFPHAYASRVSGSDWPMFRARNAIDGHTDQTGTGVTAFGDHAWSGGIYSDLEYKVYFGREVKLSQLNIALRQNNALNGDGKKHDTFWKEITVEFSDGTERRLNPVESGQKQSFDLKPAVKTSFVRLKNLVRYDTGAETQGYAALTELETIGADSGKNAPAVKTTTVNTFGGNEVKNKTHAFSAAEVKEILDFASADAREFIKSRNTLFSSQPNVTDSWWIDGVLFSAMMDAYTSTGTLDQYLFMQNSFDRFNYLIRAREAASSNINHPHHGVNFSNIMDGYNGAGEASDYADDYLIGETYLLMNDLKPAPHKVFTSYANADANMINNGPSWDNRFNSPTGTPNLPDTFNWWWCDAVYMGLNYFTLMSNATGDPSYIEKAYRTYRHWKSLLSCCGDNRHTSHGAHGLASHGGEWALWHRDDDSGNFRTNNLVNSASSQLPTFWARGNSWVFSGIAKQLLYIDQKQFPEAYQTYAEDLAAIAKTLKAYQRPDGTWRASIIDPTHRDGRETTGTSGFVYGLAIGVQLGILDSEEYLPVVEKGFQALLDARSFGHATIPDGRLVYMQAVGWNAQLYPGETGQWSTDGRGVDIMTNSFGYGLFIHAAAAVLRMCADYTPAVFSVPADSQYGVIKVPEYTGVKI